MCSYLISLGKVLSPRALEGVGRMYAGEGYMCVSTSGSASLSSERILGPAHGLISPWTLQILDLS